MKNLIFIALLLFISCSNENKTLSEDEKQKIIAEAKVLVNTIVQSCEKPDVDLLLSTYLNSPDYVSLVGGRYANYEESVAGATNYFKNVSSQKATITSEKYTVLDPTTVLYTANSKWEVRSKEDSLIIMDPVGMQFILKKVDNEWKVLSWTEEM